MEIIVFSGAELERKSSAANRYEHQKIGYEV